MYEYSCKVVIMGCLANCARYTFAYAAGRRFNESQVWNPCNAIGLTVLAFSVRRDLALNEREIFCNNIEQSLANPSKSSRILRRMSIRPKHVVCT